MTVPTKPGFYWAKWRIAEEGSETSIGDKVPGNRWEIVEVERGYEDDPDGPIVSVVGEPKMQSLENFFWGLGSGPLVSPEDEKFGHDRDILQHPYSRAERKAVDYIVKITGIGAGSDPVGFLVASHAAQNVELELCRDVLQEINDLANVDGLTDVATDVPQNFRKSRQMALVRERLKMAGRRR